jgi:predicted O-methyltransferase YrrM
MNEIVSFLKFFWKSKNEHSVHSPFVYDFVSKCLYNKKFYPEYATLKNYRKSLLDNKNFIDVTDFGAGSKIFKSNERQICQIAKSAGISLKRSELLFRIVKYFQPDTILEIGTSLGMATAAMHLGNKNAKIISLEGCSNTLNQTKFQFQKFDFDNVNFINMEFSSYFKSNNQQPTTNNFIYFDGNHSQKATLDYFNLLLPIITNDSIWIFDDIHWSSEMENAWEIIKKHKKVTVTIDTFQWGIVFFRSEQEKEDFVIRV